MSTAIDFISLQVLTARECRGESAPTSTAVLEYCRKATFMPSARARSRIAPLALLAFALVGGCSKSEEQPAAPPVMPVTVAQPIQQQVVDWDEFVGRFEAQQNVEVRPRATGYLQSVHFRE